MITATAHRAKSWLGTPNVRQAAEGLTILFSPQNAPITSLEEVVAHEYGHQLTRNVEFVRGGNKPAAESDADYWMEHINIYIPK